MKTFIRSKTLFLSLAAALLLVTSYANPADARVVVGVGIGAPLYAPAPAYYYGPAYYGPGYYPYGYAPQPYPVYPVPVPQMAPPPPPPQESADAGYCREYRHTVTVDGKPQPMHGTACRQPDGSWKIVE